MFDGEEIRIETEQQDRKNGEPAVERDDTSRVEVSSGPTERGGEVIELEVINRCSRDDATEGDEGNVVQPTTALSTLPPSSLLNSSVTTAANSHQVYLLNINYHCLLI